MDLKFPHHENEIAQTCGASNARFARLWMHNGFVNIDNEKMSKSLGNFFTLREVFAQIYKPEVLRFLLLASHYRGPINYSAAQLDQARAALNRLYVALERAAPAPAVTLVASAASARFQAVMDDDFNTPEAYAVLNNLASDINRAADAGRGDQAAVLATELRALGGVLGLLQDADWFKRGDTAVDRLVEERAVAKRERDFARADAIRQQLLAQGIVVEDRPGGSSSWRRQ
jgi:cysteinyl-tRNA synthetase